LDERRWLVVSLVGSGMGEHLLVGALGVTDDGTKVPWVVEGTTDNTAVCTRLVADLAERGLDAGPCRPGKAELEQLARSLDRQRPGAAASLREGWG
jgi:hypothetical protein